MSNHPTRTLLAVAGALVAAVATGGAASAQDPTSTGTVEVGVRSVSVDVEEFAFDTCVVGAGAVNPSVLPFPNGNCFGPPITITNGTASSVIHAQATELEGSEGGPSWQLCDNLRDVGPECSAEFGLPGVDEASIQIERADGSGAPIHNLRSDMPVCIREWSDATISCDVALPGESAAFVMRIVGPSATTNASPSFSTTITWSALPA